MSEDLIRRLHIILQVMACGHQIDPQKFKYFCDTTADLIVHLYGWYYMPVSVHKVLVHGTAVVQALPLPLGKLSEEAQEARNKDVRAYRLHNSRKDSRLHTILGSVRIFADNQRSADQLSVSRATMPEGSTGQVAAPSRGYKPPATCPLGRLRR